MKKFSLLGLFVCLLGAVAPVAAVQALYLTFCGDPAHSIAIHWIGDNGQRQTEVVSFQKKGEEYWALATSTAIPLGKEWLHRVQLMSLESDTEYVFRIGSEQQPYCFRTLSKDPSKPILIAIGGDLYRRSSSYLKMNTLVAARNPDLAVLGGDLAYAHNVLNKGSSLERWKSFFSIWQQTMQTSDGRMIPILGVPGNHDVSKKQISFDVFFPYFPNRSYGSWDVGNCTLVLLDTGHIAPIDGEQRDWLERTLRDSKAPYTIAAYHVAAFPSTESFTAKSSELIRKYWCPLFEEYKVPVVFEHHNHAFKRTHPLLSGEIDPAGVVYIGDGSWSVSPRVPKKYWYLAESKKSNSVSMVTISIEGCSVETLDQAGRVLDQWSVNKSNK